MANSRSLSPGGIVLDRIVSKGFLLPDTPGPMTDNYWFSLWRRRLWPYRELLERDRLYWYESPSQAIVWRSTVDQVERFEYQSKAEIEHEFRRRFRTRAFDPYPRYLADAPEQGFCLAWTGTNFRRMSLPKPKGLRFPQQGWLRVTGQIAHTWLKTHQDVNQATLDELAPPAASLIERLLKFNEDHQEVAPERIASVVAHTIRKDTPIIKALKALCGYRCQFPGCGMRIPKRSGGYYVEVAHIKPVHEGGRSILGNLLVVCPNHHKELDYGVLEIEEQRTEYLRGRLNGREFEVRTVLAGRSA